MPRKTFKAWASESLIGHIVLIEVTFSPAILILLLILNYQQGTLTLLWAAYLVCMVAVVGAVLATTIWYTITVKIMKHRGGKLD
jgi:hypothetical protein